MQRCLCISKRLCIFALQLGDKQHNKKQMEEKDDILEQQIKFREELLRQYIEINKMRNGGKKSKSEVIDHALDELGKLYKRRKK